MVIYGRNSVKEALRSNKTVEKLYILKGMEDPAMANIYKYTKNNKSLVISYVDKKVLDKMADKGNHQGVVAIVTDYEYSSVEDIEQLAKDSNEPLFILILDGINDPHNLGAIIRSAECFGVHGIIIPKHRSVTVNDTVIKVASGAAEHMLVAKVTNINDTIRMLKEHNVWVYATDFDGQTPKSANLTGNLAIVIGSEGDGISKLTKELCDDTLTIPQYGEINSLNASVATGIILYEAVRQRR